MIRTFVHRRVTTIMLFSGICMLGIISLQRIPLQLLPDIEFPRLTVVTSWENASPEEIEKLVTRHIEEAVSSVGGVVSIYSESIEGLSMVTARFGWGTDMDMALVETKEKADLIRGQLPEYAEKSIVIKFDPRSEPVMIYAFRAKGTDFKEMRRRVEKEIIPRLERIDGVAMVTAIGGYKRQININLDCGKIYAHNLSISKILDQVSMANYTFPAGYVEKDKMEYLIRTIGEFTGLDEIRNVVVGRNEQGTPVYLRNVATVEDGYMDRRCITRSNGTESVAVLIQKEPGKNTIEVCRSIKDKAAEIQKKYIKDFNIELISDRSVFISDAIAGVFGSGLMGGFIALMVLFFFLRELRPPLIIAASIPISILGTLSLMYFSGISINTMSLGGLALGIGMMVDSSIVVLESISQKREGNQYPSKEFLISTAIEGTIEVIPSIIASTLTTIVVFLPVVFLSGLSGAIFGELALTISYALLCSLLSAAILVPMLSALHGFRFNNKTGPYEKRTDSPIRFKKLFDLSGKVMDRIFSIYQNILEHALERKSRVILLGSAAFLIGMVLFVFIDTELMPEVDPGRFSIDITMPEGTPLSESSLLSKRIESLLFKKPYVADVFAKIGSDPEDSITEKTSGKHANSITIQVFLKKRGKRNVRHIIASLENEVRVSSSVIMDFRVQKNVIESLFAGSSRPLSIEISGREPQVLENIGKELIAKLSEYKSLKNISSSLDKGQPELKVEIDRAVSASLGLSIADIAATLKAAIHGDVSTRFRQADEEIDIRVRLQEHDRSGKESLGAIMLKSSSEASIPLSKCALIEEGKSPGKIIRSEQSRVNVISADIIGNRSTAYKKVASIIGKIPHDESYEIHLTGEYTEIANSMKGLYFALLLAVVLIYMLLASQFQSYIAPLIVMLSIPVSSLGISLSLFITGKSININSVIGIVMLAGIAVNNAIVLFDFIGLEIKKGIGTENAIKTACLRRLKPILMTTATTVLAMLPLALGIGQGSELQQPMAIAVIGGLTLSTLLTPVFIPVVYLRVFSRQNRGN